MNNNDGRDNELDQLLKPLKSSAPDDLQMKKWKSLIKKENKKAFVTTKMKWAFQLATAVAVGIFIGAVTFKSNPSTLQPPMEIAQISMPNATIQHSHANLD